MSDNHARPTAHPTDPRLRESFDGAAETYDTARPDYPTELFEDLIDLADLQPRAELLEVGCGTGKATRPLADRGFRILALELGTNLARVAQRNLADFPDVQVVQSAFEDWDPGDGSFRSRLCGHVLAVDRSRCSLPASSGSATAWRRTGVLERHARFPN
jgi:2-polyprenyl-3-methyl-5-hydroxy-6-metoxy-1,4-benzoquinol methylase